MKKKPNKPKLWRSIGAKKGIAAAAIGLVSHRQTRDFIRQVLSNTPSRLLRSLLVRGSWVPVT